MKKLLYAVLLIMLVVGSVWWYRQHYGTSGFGSGKVIELDTGNSQSARMDTGTTDIDGKPMTGQDAAPTPSRSDAPGTINGDPIAGSKAPAPAPATAPQAAPTVASAPSGLTILPTADSQPANNANGVRFAGTGKFQWYRQGNLTYRVDTETGSECVQFATEEEWHKAVVLSHGCGRAS